MNQQPLTPSGYWGKRPYFSAKVGTGPSTMVLICGASRKMPTVFHVEQKVMFAEVHRLRGMTTGCTPTWKTGRIWLIEGERLFINHR